MRTIGDLIKDYRETHDLSLREFSKICNVSHSYIDRLEKGVDPRSGAKVEPTLDTLQKIADAMNITMDMLLKETGYLKKDTTETIALHRTDGYDDDLPEEAIKEIENFKDYIRQKYKNK